MVDSAGILHPGRVGLNAEKAELAALTNPHGIRGSLGTALQGADVCVGLSGSPIAAEDLAGMNAKPIIIPLSYPDIEVRRRRRRAERGLPSGAGERPEQQPRHAGPAAGRLPAGPAAALDA